MHHLKLSLIWATYNEGENIKNFLNFWLNQDYDNYEILIVNDGSTDTTVDIIKEYLTKHGDKIKLINNDKNRWVGYTRYNGYGHATWDIIRFTDTDIAPDYPPQPDLLSRLMKPFNDDDEIDAVYIAYYPCFFEGNMVRSLENFYYYAPTLNPPSNYLTLRNPALHMPTLFRNKKLDLSKVQHLKNGEDRFIATKFLKEARKIWLAEGIYLLDVNNLSRSELAKRYISYGKNSLGLLASNKKMFLLHLMKPIVVALALLSLIVAFFTNWLLILPFCFIYGWLFVLTIIWFLKMKKKKYGRPPMYCLILWPTFLLLRYIYLFIWILLMKNTKKKK